MNELHHHSHHHDPMADIHQHHQELGMSHQDPSLEGLTDAAEDLRGHHGGEHSMGHGDAVGLGGNSGDYYGHQVSDVFKNIIPKPNKS